MAKDDAPEPQAADIEGPVGIKPAPGKMRPKPDNKRIAARVARFIATDSVESELLDGVDGRVGGVTLLNPGFFQLERMRASTATKKRGKVRAKVRGK